MVLLFSSLDFFVGRDRLLRLLTLTGIEIVWLKNFETTCSGFEIVVIRFVIWKVDVQYLYYTTATAHDGTRDGVQY